MTETAETPSPARAADAVVRVLTGSAEGGDGRLALLLVANAFVLRAGAYLLGVAAKVTELRVGPAVASIEVRVGVFLVVLAGYVAILARRSRLFPAVAAPCGAAAALLASVALTGLDREGPGPTIGALASLFALALAILATSHAIGFAADVCTPTRGLRLFGLVAAGDAVGALLASQGARALVHGWGTAAAFAVSATLLLLSVPVSIALHRFVPAGAVPDEEAALRRSCPPDGVLEGLRDRYVLVLGLYIAVVGLGRDLVGRTLAEALRGAGAGSDAFSERFLIGTVASAILALAFARLTRSAGLLSILVAAPVLTVAAAGAELATSGVGAAIVGGAAVRGSTTLGDTAWAALWLTAPRGARYSVRLLFVMLSDATWAVTAGAVAGGLSQHIGRSLTVLVALALAASTVAVVAARGFHARATRSAT